MNWHDYCDWVGVDRDPQTLRDWAAKNPEAHWSQAAQWLELIPAFERPVERSSVHWVHDRWFPDSGVNVSCITDLARQLPALTWQSETDRRSRSNRGELADLARSIAAHLEGLGVGPGDRIGIHAPLQPGIVAALLAVPMTGATVVPVFSGLSTEAVLQRGRLANVKGWITARHGTHGGRYRPFTDELVAAGGKVLLSEPCTAIRAPYDPRAGQDDWLLLFTSGTTGTPKGVLHRHAGWLVKAAFEVAVHLDVTEGDRVCWITDPGWVVFPWIVTGTLHQRACLHLLEGKPNAARVWAAVESQGLTHLGISPSLARQLRAQDPWPHSTWNLESVRVVASSGEPWDPDTWNWMTDVFPGRHMANVSGGTEIGSLILGPLPGEQLDPCSLGGPSPGMDVASVAGELCLRGSWPSVPRLLDADVHGTYIAGGTWRHGDRTVVRDGQWFLEGRSDETLNVNGKRMAPQEMEHVAMQAHQVLDCAATDHGLFVVAEPWDDDDEVVRAVHDRIDRALGRPYRPKEVFIVPELPRTPSGKLQRRLLGA